MNKSYFLKIFLKLNKPMSCLHYVKTATMVKIYWHIYIVKPGQVTML